MIIFANVLLDKQIFSSATFTALLLMAVASICLAVLTASTHRYTQLPSCPQDAGIQCHEW